MAAVRSTKHEASLLEQLRLAIHGVSAPFTTAGTLVPQQPVALSFPDHVRFPMQLTSRPYERDASIERLVTRCAPAPFGHGKRTRYDRRVRDALQLNAEGGAFTIENFDPESAGILEQVRRELAPQDESPLRTELYSLNIYKGNGHFAPHKDTPRGIDMLGTLVVCLPSRFSNGALVLKHRGVHRTFDWAKDIDNQKEPTRLHWAAFFGDVDHQIEKLWSGHRVTVTYIIRRGKGSAPHLAVSPAAQPSQIQTSLRNLLDDPHFRPRGGRLAVPCSHLYHQEACFQRELKPLTRDSLTTLKGRDHQVAAAALAEGLTVTLNPYLIEDCADETWQLGHFPTPKEKKALGARVTESKLEKTLDLRASSNDTEDFGLAWVEPAPHFNFAPTLFRRHTVFKGEDDVPDVDPDLPAIAHLHSCEYSATGYFGNEGSDLDFYVFAALHVEIPPYGEGGRNPHGSAANSRPALKAATETKPRAGKPKVSKLLAGGNPQVAKADGDAAVQAYIDAMPGWKRGIGKRLDALVVREVPDVCKAVKWNSPLYGIEGHGWLLGFHVFARYVKVTFFRGTALHPVPPGGKGKDARWIDIHEDDFDEATLGAWVMQASALPGWVP